MRRGRAPGIGSNPVIEIYRELRGIELHEFVKRRAERSLRVPGGSTEPWDIADAVGSERIDPISGTCPLSLNRYSTGSCEAIPKITGTRRAGKQIRHSAQRVRYAVVQLDERGIGEAPSVLPVKSSAVGEQMPSGVGRRSCPHELKSSYAQLWYLPAPTSDGIAVHLDVVPLDIRDIWPDVNASNREVITLNVGDSRIGAGVSI